MIVWISFFVLISIFLALDLGVFHKKNTLVSMKASLIWTSIWVTLSLLFGLVVYSIYEFHWLDLNTHSIKGSDALLQYYTGYILEESLSLDNIFVIAMIFNFFKIRPEFQHRVLFWGIIGAVFFRLLMILLGQAFIARFEWAMYVFGAILIWSAFQMIKKQDETNDFKQNLGVRLLGKIYPIDWSIQSGVFFKKIKGKHVATPLLATLVVIEFSDILFAVDSIPAIFGVTNDPFIIFSSNIFAILGLRSLYFFLSGMLDKFKYIKIALVFVLLFIGIKMIFHHQLPVLKEQSWISLVVIVSAIFIAVIASIISNRKATKIN